MTSTTRTDRSDASPAGCGPTRAGHGRRTARRLRATALVCGSAAVVATQGVSWTVLAVVVVLLAAERSATDRRHRRELTEADRLANTDELTGLANRRALLTTTDHALAEPGVTGLILIDLDGFKTVNDTHGHATGDHVLRLVAARLNETMPRDHLIARVGGDEFAVLAPGTDQQTLPVLATRARGALTRPLPLTSGQHLRIGTSTGTATQTASTRTATDLLHQADTAMYRTRTRTRAPAHITDHPTHPDRRRHADFGGGPGRPPDHGPPRQARAATEALLALNEEVDHGHGYLWPSQIHTTISHLWLLTHQLNTTLTHAARWLEDQHTAGRVREHSTPDATPAVRTALDHLTAAITTNHQTTQTLDAARHHTDGLTGHPFGHDLARRNHAGHLPEMET